MFAISFFEVNKITESQKSCTYMSKVLLSMSQISDYRSAEIKQNGAEILERFRLLVELLSPTKECTHWYIRAEVLETVMSYLTTCNSKEFTSLCVYFTPVRLQGTLDSWPVGRWELTLKNTSNFDFCVNVVRLDLTQVLVQFKFIAIYHEKSLLTAIHLSLY